MTAIVVCLLFGGPVSSSSWAASNESIILVKPFQINASEQLDFLKKGIDQMLATRLTEPGRYKVVFASDIQNTDAIKADYIVEGSLLIFGDQVSTDVNLLAADTGKVALNVSQTGSNKGDVIKHIDLFANKARSQVLGTGAPTAEPPAPVVAAPTPQKMPDPAQDVATLPPSTESIWRGPFMKKAIDSFQVADIDNDGTNEIIILADDTIEIHRREFNRLVSVSETKIDRIDLTCLFVDAIDLDGDGQKELCMTAATKDHTRATSFIYRVENMKPVLLLGPVNYLFNVVDTANGPILLGQKTRGTTSQLLKTPIMELRLATDGQHLEAAGRSFPFADNVFGIAFGDFTGSGTEAIAVLALNGTISLYSAGGVELYKGSDEYGGSATYVAYKGMRYTKDDGYALDRIFLQQQLFATDLDGSGKKGLIVVNNRDSARKILSSTRIFGKSHIDQLTWNGLGLEIRKTGQTITGYISDYCIADSDSNGNREIVFCVVSPAKLFKGKRSQLVSMPLY